MHTIFIYERSPGRLILSFVKSDYVRDIRRELIIWLPSVTRVRWAALRLYFIFVYTQIILYLSKIILFQETYGDMRKWKKK